MRIGAGALCLGLVLVAAAAEAKLPDSTVLVSGSIGHRGVFSEAGDEGAVLRLEGGATVVVAPRTELRQLPATDLNLGPGPLVHTTVLVLRQGRVTVSSPAAARRAVLVKAPRDLGGICRGGRMVVLAGPRSSTVANLDGVALAAVGTVWKPLPPASAGTVGSDQSLEVTSLLPAPRWKSAAPILVATREQVMLREVEWRSVQGTVGHRLVLHRVGATEPTVEVDCPGQRLCRPLSLEPGRYQLEVQGVDARGLPGAVSRPLEVAVVGTQLPPGGYVDPQGALRLPRGGTVGLVGVEGLEMSTGNAAWVPAPHRTWLHREVPMQVRLRRPGSADSAALTLAPRQVRASVWVGPKDARWPSDPVSIHVVLTTPSGAAVPSVIQPESAVTLNGRELELQWRRDEDGWSASVAPRTDYGPWVIRVEVTDQHGVPLGRDFLEVEREAYEPPSPRLLRRGSETVVTVHKRPSST